MVRYEHDGTATVLADNFGGKKLNSPNDVVAHPDGSYWFTDPPYGGQLYEGEPDVAGGPSNLAGKLNPRIGQPAGFVPGKRELPTNCYRIDPSGRLDLVVTEEQVPDPNGLCFSPDYKKLYVASTGKGPGDTGPGGKGEMFVFDVGTDNKLTNHKRFSDFMVDGVKCGPDGVRCDVNGNVWCSSNAGRAVGYSGVTVWSPDGKLHRPHPPAGGVRQRLLRRPQAQPPVHGREPVALRRLYRHARRRAGVARSASPRHSPMRNCASGSRLASRNDEGSSLKFVTNWQPAANRSGKSWARLNPAFMTRGAPSSSRKGRGLCTNAHIQIFYRRRIDAVCFPV